MSVAGHWEGKLVDVTGLTAYLALDLQGAGTSLQGDFSVQLLPEAGGFGEPPGLPPVQKGPVKGSVDEANGRIELRYAMPVGTQPVVSIDGRLTGALPHAKQAIFGCFQIHEGLGTLTLEGGGVVLWQYEGAGA